MNKKLTLMAIDAMNHSYSPYSLKKVGCVIELSSGDIVQGCNVENSSYGATICAERTAVLRAVAEFGPHIKIGRVVVATDDSPPWSPCGLCRQVLNEFATADMELSRVNPQGEEITHKFKDLFPHGFDRSALMSP